MASFQRNWEIEYDPEDNKDKTRTIGVEFECTISNEACPLYYADDYEEDPYDYDPDYDDEENHERSIEFRDYIMEKYNLSIPGVGRDGSGFEFVTEPDSISLYKKGGSNRFKNFVKFLTENGTPHEADGTHLHISKLDSDPEVTYKHLKWITSNFGLQMQKIFGRVSSWAMTAAQIRYWQDFCNCTANQEIECILMPKEYQKTIEKKNGNKEGMVINRTHTYEFRGGKGSNDIDEVLAWIEMAHNMVNLATKTLKTIENTPFSHIVTGEHIEKYLKKIQENPNRAFSQEELDQTIATNKFIQILSIPSNRGRIL